jgi:hypothetical protein
MKKLTMILPSILLAGMLMAGCSTTAQVTVGDTFIAMHDLVKTGAIASDSLCKAKTIPAADCAAISKAYQKIQLVWPVVDDALIIYLKSDPTDALATQNFQAAQAQWSAAYSDMLTLLTKTGVIKTTTATTTANTGGK